MENEKLIEMLAEINKTMLEMKKDQQEMRVEMREGFESVIKRIDTLENTVGTLGTMFEHVVEMQQDSAELMNQTMGYISHKVAEHDKEIFNLKFKQ